jgi:NDP-sugar pyrophosphorylase family protein
MSMQDYRIENMYDLSQTIAADLFAGKEYPWEVLGDISDFIVKLGNTLPADRFEKRGENVWVAKSAKIFDSAYIGGPCIIDEEAEIRQCAFIRGSAIVGKKAVVGNSTELKNVVLFDLVQVPHYNYVGDSVLGVHAHMGAGSITSNVKADNKEVVIHAGEENMETGRRKIGAMLGDYVDIGCNSVLNPGTVIGRHTNVYPVSMVRGCVPAFHIYKDKDHVVEKRMD